MSRQIDVVKPIRQATEAFSEEVITEFCLNGLVILMKGSIPNEEYGVYESQTHGTT